MSYKVTSPLVIVPNADGTSGDGYFYKDAVIPAGFNDKRANELVDEGMVEKVKADSGTSEKSDKVDDILAEVGDDKDKAQAALDAENAKEKPRATLVGKLEGILGKA